MATSTSWAQDFITCNLCNKPTQQFCNSCHVNLCSDCLSKRTDAFQSMSHEIAPFLDRKTKLVLPECKEQSGQRCEVNCKECNTPACLKCIASGTHKGHDVEELTETHENKIRKIKSDTEEIQVKLISKFQKEDVAVGNNISKTKSKFEDVGKEIKKLRKIWHQEVDKIFDKIESLSQSLTEKNLNALQEYHNTIRDLISEMNTLVKQNEKLFKSNKLLEVNKYKSKLNYYQYFSKHVNWEIPSLRSYMHQGKELILEIGGYRAMLKLMSPPSPSADVSHLTTGRGKLIDQVSVIATIPTNYKPLAGVVCVGGSEAWTYGQNKTITHIDMHGAVRDTVSTSCLNWPNDISVTRGRELIYGDNNSKTVKIVRHGKSETLITTPQGWRPGRLSCTKSGDTCTNAQVSNQRTKKFLIRDRT